MEGAEERNRVNRDLSGNRDLAGGNRDLSESDRGHQGLALWIFGPLLGLAAVWLAIMNLPGSNCDGSPVEDGLQEAVLILVTCVASLATCLAALTRLKEMHRAGHWAASPGFLCGFVAALLIGAAVGGAAFGVQWIVALILIGVFGSAVLLVALLVAWVGRRNVDQAGPLVPAYLLGAGLACYPISTLFALAVESGGLC